MDDVVKDELKDLNKMKQQLMRNFDNDVIDKNTYEEDLKGTQDKIDSIVKKCLDTNADEIKKEDKIEVDETMKSEDNTKKPGKAPRADSYTMLIINALMKKGIKNISEVVERVNIKKPGRDLKKIETQTKTIIYLVKQQKVKRWLQYNWDAEKFLLTIK